MKIIDGKQIAIEIRAKLKEEISLTKEIFKTEMGLVVILAGDNPSSRIYVNSKIAACAELGVTSYFYDFPKTVETDEILTLIDTLNQNPAVNGILVQLPLYRHLDERTILDRIDVKKDVDGFSPYQTGKLVIGEPELIPCTPKAVIEMLEWSNIDVTGMNAVVIGRSNIVGKPLFHLLLQKNATVTVCHSKTVNLAEITSKADLLVAAIGKPWFIKRDMVKEGAVVIDVGINKVDGKVVGDVDFEAVKEKCSYITPVPGGVGPMTITMLIANTLKAYKVQHGGK